MSCVITTIKQHLLSTAWNKELARLPCPSGLAGLRSRHPSEA